MKIAVILCTYNRFQSLAGTLESLAASCMPVSVHWRVLVVDNNSNDQTRSVVEDFARRFAGRFEYLFEPRQGKSYALNLGVQHADADVLCFVDDDVQVDPHWLERLSAALEDPQWSGGGGRILPQVRFIPPRWLDTEERYALAPLAIFDPAISAGELRESPFGTNMAIRREMFLKYGGFRMDLGPQPGGEIKNEDVEFGWRILDAGERLCYVPDAVVYHSIPDHRVTKSYFLTWWYGKGRSEIRQSGVNGDHRLSALSVQLDFFGRLVVWTVRWLLAFHSARRFSCKMRVWQLAGKIRECFAQSRKAHRIRATQLPNEIKG